MPQPRQVVVVCDYIDRVMPGDRTLRAWISPGPSKNSWMITTEKYRAQVFETKDQAAKAKNAFVAAIERMKGTQQIPPQVSNFRIVQA